MFRDMEPLRFSYENDLLRVIRAQLGALPRMEHARAKHLLSDRHRELLGDAIRITPDLLPEVHAVCQSCLDTLGSDISGDLFVRQSKEYNASVFALGRKFDVLVNSGLLNDFSPDELRFVFGHELGHVMFEHSRISVHGILSGAPKPSPDTANLLFRWSRASEVSADRLGLLCCGKLAPATTALFRTASGLSGIDTDRVLRSLRSQYEELEDQLRKASETRTWIRMHPMIPIRFKALELAALDIVALRQQSRGFSWKGFRAIDRRIAEILEAIDARVIPSVPCQV